ncbi:IPT/TIG domain-containing protein [candidate division KSB1 bacterium]|nr:IPT/TIG domain-containing protein [candidate division KSB1 bacterium]
MGPYNHDQEIRARMFWVIVAIGIGLLFSRLNLQAQINPTAMSSDANPALFFTDIESGPNQGGQENLGAFITIYGEGFGTARNNSTVTIGGHEVARYVIWGEDNAPARNLDLIVVQPGPNVTSGNIMVTVNGKVSDPLPFTVRSGEIYFVIPGSPNANDTNPGSYDAPFKTLYRPRQSLKSGDIVYIRSGTFSTADPSYPGWDAILLLHPDTDVNGTADQPVAYIGYPGYRPVLGSSTLRRGIYMDESTAYYVFANLEFTQHAGALQPSGKWHRMVGNYFHDGINAESAVIGVAGNTAHLKIYGNLLRNNGETGDLAGHALYIQGFGTNQDIDFGWNQIRDHRGRRAIQLFGHVDGDRMDNIRIHDNLISGSVRENILLGGSDGGTEVLGTINIYNNIIIGGDDQGLRINDPQGTVIIQNNVLYNNGAHGVDGNGQLYIERAGIGRITLENNIVYAEPGQTYYQFGPDVSPAVFSTASNNLWYHAGTTPVWDVNHVSADPMFMDLASGDFRLKENSPAINAGINIGISRDYFGQPRDSKYDIGAYEYPLTVGTEDKGCQQILPRRFILHQNFPNPFNLQTTINFSLSQLSLVRLAICNTRGELVNILLDEMKSVGNHAVIWNGKDYQGNAVVSGIYYCQIATGAEVVGNKMLLLK